MVSNVKIGEQAARAGCQVAPIRYYEQRGLLAAPQRSSGNYRLYGQAHIASQDQPEQPCCGVNALLDQHIEANQRKIAEFQSLQDQLPALRARCQSTVQTGECEILRDLGSAQY